MPSASSTAGRSVCRHARALSTAMSCGHGASCLAVALLGAGTRLGPPERLLSQAHERRDAYLRDRGGDRLTAPMCVAIASPTSTSPAGRAPRRPHRPPVGHPLAGRASDRRPASKPAMGERASGARREVALSANLDLDRAIDRSAAHAHRTSRPSFSSSPSPGMGPPRQPAKRRSLRISRSYTTPSASRRRIPSAGPPVSCRFSAPSSGPDHRPRRPSTERASAARDVDDRGSP